MLYQLSYLAARDSVAGSTCDFAAATDLASHDTFAEANKSGRMIEEEIAFDRAVEEVTAAADRLISSLSTSAPPRNREEEARKARDRGRIRAMELKM